MAQYDPFINKQAIQRGYWIAMHRLALEKWMSIGLYIVITASYLIFFVQFGVYLYQYGEWGKIVSFSTSSNLDWASAHAKQAPLELEFGTPIVFPRPDDKYDFVVEVYNPNKQWGVSSFTYQFGTPTQKFPEEQGFILPQERKFLTQLGVSSNEALQELTFTKFPYQWLKVSRLPNFSWIFDGDPAYHPQQVVINNNEQKVVPARVTWAVTNGSTLNIRSVSWQVALYQGTTPVGFVQYERDKSFSFLEKQEFDISLFESLPAVDIVKVIPVVNIFDPDFIFTPST